MVSWKKKVLRLLFLGSTLALAGITSFGQRAPNFYNIDTEKEVEGSVQEILFEPRYKDSAPFLILILQEKKTGQKYVVEVSPVWFFNYDFHKGEKVKVIGSLYSKDETLYLIARELQAGGETYLIRDTRGFPNWRGGQVKGKGGRRRGPGI